MPIKYLTILTTVLMLFIGCVSVSAQPDTIWSQPEPKLDPHVEAVMLRIQVDILMEQIDELKRMNDQCHVRLQITELQYYEMANNFEVCKQAFTKTL